MASSMASSKSACASTHAFHSSLSQKNVLEMLITHRTAVGMIDESET
jgi:hypothetical protein